MEDYFSKASLEEIFLDKKIILGVTGAIAAYKSVEICRQLVQLGAHVIPILTQGATNFVGPMTFSALGSEPVKTSLWDSQDPLLHTRLAKTTQAILIAPASANSIARFALGIADDLLSSVVLASKCPIVIAPSMHLEMWEHPALQNNISLLAKRGVKIIEPASGALAGGDFGKGRLASAEVILEALGGVVAENNSSIVQDFKNTTVLVSAGGTKEPIDQVRYLANRSSGKQGHALAVSAHKRGAKVYLVTASDLEADPAIETIRVTTSDEMAHEVLKYSPQADVVIMAAAVADFKPKTFFDGKLSRSYSPTQLELQSTTDIVSNLVSRQKPSQLIVAFAAEATGGLQRAKEKLKDKQVDLLVFNDISQPQVGFDYDTNSVTILSKQGDVIVQVPVMDKVKISDIILDSIVKEMEKRHQAKNGVE